MDHILETKPDLTIYELCHYIERVPQPVGDQQFNPTKSGDCFLCSSYSIVCHFCKLKGVKPPSMAEVYKVWAHKDVDAPNGSNYWANKAFWNSFNYLLGWWDLEVEMVEDAPLGFADRFPTAFGPKFYTGLSLKQRVQTYLEAGYLIHAEIQHKPTTEYVKEGKKAPGGDHLVVIDGIRTVSKQKLSCLGDGKSKPSWYAAIQTSLHVVDSSSKHPDPYWIEVNDYIEQHGGYSMWFVRPKREKSYSFPESEECAQHPVV